MTGKSFRAEPEEVCNDPACPLFHASLWDSFGLQVGWCNFETEHERDSFVAFMKGQQC